MKKYQEYYEQYLAPCSVRHVGVESFQRTWTSEVERDANAKVYANIY